MLGLMQDQPLLISSLIVINLVILYYLVTVIRKERK